MLPVRRSTYDEAVRRGHEVAAKGTEQIEGLQRQLRQLRDRHAEELATAMEQAAEAMRRVTEVTYTQHEQTPAGTEFVMHFSFNADFVRYTQDDGYKKFLADWLCHRVRRDIMNAHFAHEAHRRH